jgi:hypothetical protein
LKFLSGLVGSVVNDFVGEDYGQGSGVDDRSSGVILLRCRAVFTESDVQELGRTVLADFDRRVSVLPEGFCAPFHQEARQLETELMVLYGATVLCVRRQEDLRQVAMRWAEMVAICDGSINRLQHLAEKHPGCGADIYEDRIFELRSKCQRLQEMHQ